MKKEIKLICQNPDCKKEFYVDRKHIHSKYCSKKCSYFVHNKKTIAKKREKAREQNKNKLCLECGKVHDHTYGSGLFCSRECQYIYIGKISAPKGGVFKPARGDWECPVCGDKFRVRRDKQKHLKEKHPEVDPKCWIKGLTKETSVAVRRNAESVQKGMRKLYDSGYRNSTQNGEYWTPERRKQKSEEKKKLYTEHPELHPNITSAKNKGNISRPERIARDWLIENKIQFEPQYSFVTDEFRRYVDFYVPKYNLFIEIDGEHWHQDKDKDKRKDIDAANHGFITLRIPTKKKIRNELKLFFDNLNG